MTAGQTVPDLRAPNKSGLERAEGAARRPRSPSRTSAGARQSPATYDGRGEDGDARVRWYQGSPDMSADDRDVAPFAPPARPGLQSRLWRQITRRLFRYMANPALPPEVRRRRMDRLIGAAPLPRGTRVAPVWRAAFRPSGSSRRVSRPTRCCS